jgi:hypothetical protein
MGELTLLSDTTLRVNPFVAVVQGTHNTKQGQYLVPNDELVDLAVTAKDASQARRALVAVSVADSAEAGVAPSSTTDRAWLQIVPGNLAPSSPALPAAPANSLLLGELLIPSVASGQPVTLTPYNPRTTTRGGILPVFADSSTVPGHGGELPLFDGQVRWHPTNGLEVGSGGAWGPPSPQRWVDLVRNTTYSATTAVGSAFVTMTGMDFTVPNLPVGREVEVEWRAPYATQPASSTTAFRLALNGAVVDVDQASTSTVAYYRGFRLSGSVIVPASGAVTMQVQSMTNAGAATSVGVGTGGTGGAVVLRYRVR